MFKKFLLLTLQGIRHRQLRSWLTILGVVISIVLVVTILALSSGLKQVISDQVQRFGSDLIVVLPGKDNNPFISLIGGQKFKEEDIKRLIDIEGVDYVLPTDVILENVEYKGDPKTILTHGSPWEGLRLIFEESQGGQMYEGKWPVANSDNEAVLGYTIANNLFREKPRIGDEIIVKTKRLKIAGFLSETGNIKDDNSIYIPREVFGIITGIKNKTSSALIKTKPKANLNLIEKQIRFELSKQDEVRDFSVITPDKADRIIGNILLIVELGLIVIAFIALIVGAVGIMNTMYTSVLERTREIGIMKAIGASDEAILSIFLLESGLIGIIGGIAGLAIGLLSAYLIGVIGEQSGIFGLFTLANIETFDLAIVLVITFIIGIISGVLPARNAAKMEPAEALRFE